MKILVLNSLLKEKHKKVILDAAEKINAKACFANTEDEVEEDFKDAEVIYGFGMKIAKESKDLKWLAVPSAGVDYLMHDDAFANKDCILTNSAGAYGVTIAEHIVAVSLMMMRGLDHAYSETLKGNWSSPIPQKSLKDARITVLGTGDIGCEFAKRARAFEPASITGICKSGKCEERSFDSIHKVDELDSILPKTDLLVMCLPGTPETENILSKERIKLLPKDAYVVNVGRGSAIDEDALADSLDEKRLAGAALDVFKNEPLPKESRLWKTKNLIITPHVAGNLTLEHTLDKNVEMFIDNLLCYANGLEMKHVIDRNKGY